MNISNKKILKIIFTQLVEILILLAICTFATYMFAGKIIFKNFYIYSNSVFYSFIVGLSIWKGNQLLGVFLDKWFPWEQNPTSTFFYHFSAAVVYTAIDIIIVNYLVFKYIYKTNLTDRIGEYANYAIVQFGISILIISIIFLKHFFLSWKNSITREEKLKSEALTLQYETLKSYVNPHFLFNSLSVLSSLVEKDTAKSQEFIKQLSNIYRYVLEQKDKELVPLSTELSFIESYINLHRIRHGENLRVDLSIDDKSGQIIPLSMQILLENAFKHNIISEEEPFEVKIWREDDYIIVQNILNVRKTIKDSDGIGLETIRKRYEFFTKQPLLVNNNNGFFTVKIPVLDLSVFDGYK